MSSINNRYFRGSEWGYVPTADYKKISKSQQHPVYRLGGERYGTSRNDAITATSKECDNLNFQVSAFSKKVDDSLIM